MDKRQESLRQLLNDLANKTFVDFKYYKLRFNEVATDLLRFLLLSTIVKDNEISISLFYDKGIQSACLPLNRFDSETMLQLKLYEDSSFKIELLYWNLDQVFKEYKHELKPEEIEILPEGLVNIMREVLRNEKPTTVNANSLKA